MSNSFLETQQYYLSIAKLAVLCDGEDEKHESKRNDNNNNGGDDFAASFDFSALNFDNKVNDNNDGESDLNRKMIDNELVWNNARSHLWNLYCNLKDAIIRVNGFNVNINNENRGILFLQNTYGIINDNELNVLSLNHSEVIHYLISLWCVQNELRKFNLEESDIIGQLQIIFDTSAQEIDCPGYFNSACIELLLTLLDFIENNDKNTDVLYHYLFENVIGVDEMTYVAPLFSCLCFSLFCIVLFCLFRQLVFGIVYQHCQNKKELN